MHYKSLLIAHRAFYSYEPRASKYDDYLRGKNWRNWESPEVPATEIENLFSFIRKWDYHFRGNPRVFKRAYARVYPIIRSLRRKNIAAVNLTSAFYKKEIPHVFDTVARCCLEDRYESTDASKMLHTIVPEFFIMWDRNIRKGVLGSESRYSGGIYASEFLPHMQKELEEAIETCTIDRGVDRPDAIALIERMCEGKTLAKAADQYNYMLYTMSENFRSYLKKTSSQLPPKELEYLNNAIRAVLPGTRVDANKRRQNAEIRYRQKQYCQFISLLDELKRRRLIDANDWRDYSRRWTDNVEEKDTLTRRLKSMLQHSENRETSVEPAGADRKQT